MKIQFYINQVWLHKEKNLKYRILYLNPNLDLFAWISLEKSFKVFPETMTLPDALLLAEKNKISLSSEDPFPPANAKNLNPPTRSRWEKNWVQLRPYLSDSHLILHKSFFTSAVGKISKATGASRNKIYKLFIRYWQRGQNKAALIPDYDNTARKGKEKRAPEKATVNTQSKSRRLTEKEKREVVSAYKLFYIERPQSSLEQAYLNYLALKHRKKDPLLLAPPSFWQFRYWGEKNYVLNKRREAKEGKIITQKDRRPITGSQQEGVIGPGSLYQIDSTPADIELVSEIDRSILTGSPTLYLVTDVFSGMIVGFYAGYEKPSYFCAMLALSNAIEDKVEFCHNYNIQFKTADWPSCHLPTSIVADGGELMGNQAENLVNELGISVENTAAYRPDLKGLVEKHFQTVHKSLKTTLPNIGHKGPHHGERGVRNARKDACLTLKEYIQVLIHQIKTYNNESYLKSYPLDDLLIQHKINPVPCQLWSWGLQNYSGQLKSLNKNEFLFRLLPRKIVGLTKKGIKLHHQYYNPTKGPTELLEDVISMQLDQQHKSKRVEILYHPWDLSTLHMPHKGGYVSFTVSETRSPAATGRSEWEILQMEANKLKQKSKFEKKSLIGKVESITEIHKILSHAKENLIPNKKNTTKIKKINENTEVERQLNRDKADLRPTADPKLIPSNKHQNLEDENSFPSLYDDLDKLIENGEKYH